jgi:serine/threonine protein kinase
MRLCDSFDRIHEKRLEMGSSVVSDADLLDQAVSDPTGSPTDTGVLDLRQFPGSRRFEVRRRLGEGGFGEVYESYDTATSSSWSP